MKLPDTHTQDTLAMLAMIESQIDQLEAMRREIATLREELDRAQTVADDLGGEVTRREGGAR
jgi:N-acetylglutamate synthase/N-acetylornithine aminotransferase